MSQLEHSKPALIKSRESSKLSLGWLDESETLEEIIIDNHDFAVLSDLKSDREKWLKLGEGHPELREVDKLCPSFNAVDNVCTVKDKQIRFTHDIFYTTDKSLVLDGSKVKCLNTNYTPCTMHIHMAGDEGSYLVLKNGSSI